MNDASHVMHVHIYFGSYVELEVERFDIFRSCGDEETK